MGKHVQWLVFGAGLLACVLSLVAFSRVFLGPPQQQARDFAFALGLCLIGILISACWSWPRRAWERRGGTLSMLALLWFCTALLLVYTGLSIFSLGPFLVPVVLLAAFVAFRASVSRRRRASHRRPA